MIIHNNFSFNRIVFNTIIPKNFAREFDTRKYNSDTFDCKTLNLIHKTSFLENKDIEFIKEFTNKEISVPYTKINLFAKKLDEQARLEKQHKRNLFEHMLTKTAQNKSRSINKLISYIKLFSKNKMLSSMTISDLSKYLLENPDVEPKKIYKISKKVFGKTKNNEYYPNKLKIIKLLYKNKNLVPYYNANCNSYQLYFLQNFSSEFIDKLKSLNDIKDLSVNEKFDLLKAIYKTNTNAFNNHFNKIFPILPTKKSELPDFIKQIQNSICDERPIKVKAIGTLDRTIQNILINHQPQPLDDKKDFYMNLAEQINFQQENLNISQKGKILIAKILTILAYLSDSNDPNALYKSTLILKNNEVLDLAKKIIFPNLKEKQVEKINTTLSNIGTNVQIKHNDFTNVHYADVTIKTFSDGTKNKIIDFRKFKNENYYFFVHSSTFDITGILPLLKSKNTKTNSRDLIFSATYVNPTNQIKPFRQFGVILNVNPQNILGGATTDLATGYDKTIDNFAETLFSEEYKSIRDFFKLQKVKIIKNRKNKKHTDISDSITSCKRIDGRRYNEFLLLEPSIAGIYAYVDNLNEIPYEYRKFAQDNNLFIVNLKPKKEKL